MNTSPTARSFTAGSIAFVALAAAFAGFLSPAHAQSPSPNGAAQRVVETDGRSTEAVKADIAAAARKVCQFTSTHSPITPWEDGRCRRQAEKQALAQLEPAPSQLATRD